MELKKSGYEGLKEAEAGMMGLHSWDKTEDKVRAEGAAVEEAMDEMMTILVRICVFYK